MRMVVLLSRRHRLFAAAAGWKVPGVELFLFDSPSEALAKLSLGHTAVFVFDTRDYPRHRHVARQVPDAGPRERGAAPPARDQAEHR